MSLKHEINGAALDRHITGNYGEDRFNGTKTCPDCGELFWPEIGEETHCFLCGERDCDCGDTWKAIEDPESVNWTDPDDVPEDCPVCRCAAKIDAAEGDR